MPRPLRAGYNLPAMTRSPLVAPTLLSLALLLAPRIAGAADAPSALAAQRAAASAKVRAAVPAPLEPEEGQPGLGFSFEGDLVVAGENAGTVTVTVDVGTFRDQPVWLVTEAVVEDWAGTRQTTEASYWLARDLTLVRGEWQRSSPSRFTRLEFARKGDAFEVSREDGDPTKEMPPAERRSLPAPSNATFGRGALLLLLRYAPADPATYELPLVGLDGLMPGIDEHEPAVDPAPLAVEVRGAAKWGEAPDVRDSWLAVTRHAGRVAELHLDPKGRGLIGIDQRRPPGIRIVPKGKGGARAVYEDDQPAKTWKACFLKFGHGYHMAVEKWIDGAIDWDQVFAHDVATGAVSKDWKVADLRKAYVDEFLARSKHRPRAEADALLRMTLATADEKKLADGTVVLATSPEFGGNVFHFRSTDGVWKIVRIDQ